MPVFDVFLSYSRADRDTVERLGRALRDRGLTVFVDRWYLVAGQSWPEALEKHLRDCRAVAVCIGASGMGAWQQREHYKALDRQAHEPGFPVIPVLLPERTIRRSDFSPSTLGSICGRVPKTR